MQRIRVGLIADQPLSQHLLQKVLSEEGYEIGVNTHPDNINPAMLRSDTIRIWVVDLSPEGDWDGFLDLLLDTASAPVFFGEGETPDRGEDSFFYWRRRLVKKVKDLCPPVIPPDKVPAIYNLESLLAATREAGKEVIDLPSSFSSASPTDVQSVWVIAASLGGPSAVKAFFDLLPDNLPCAFLYAQHIDQGCLDALVASVGRHTRLDMVLATEGMQLQNGKILVVPVSNEIRFRQNHSVEVLKNGWSGPYGPSIDHLFSNVSERYREQANAIVFSGMGSDGTLGAQIMVQNGGNVWAQDRESAIEPSMPNSANDAGCVSFRGSPEQLARRLIYQIKSRGKAPEPPAVFPGKPESNDDSPITSLQEIRCDQAN